MRIFKFLALPPFEKVFLLIAYYHLVLWRIRLVFNSFSSLLDKCRTSPLAKIPSSQLMPISSLVRLLNTANALVPGSTCLSKAFAAHILLKKNGYLTELHIGVIRNFDNLFQAHAWLSFQGEVLIGMRPELNDYRDILSEKVNPSQFS